MRAGLPKCTTSAIPPLVREVEGKLQRGFKIVVGGGLGPVPRQARVLTEFAPVEEMLPLTQAACRVFGKHGEKKNRNAARIKFLVDKWGIEKFREEVFAARKELREDPRWLDRLKGAEQAVGRSAQAAGGIFLRWTATNASSGGSRPMSATSVSPAMSPPRSPSRWATSPRTNFARWRT